MDKLKKAEKKASPSAGKKNKRKNQKEFDSTLGYPGEGPERLRMATFNVRGLKGKDDDGMTNKMRKLLKWPISVISSFYNGRT